MNRDRARRPVPHGLRRPSRGRCLKTKLVRYSSRDAAIAAAIRISNYLGPLEIRRCEHCGDHHLRRPTKG